MLSNWQKFASAGAVHDRTLPSTVTEAVAPKILLSLASKKLKVTTPFFGVAVKVSAEPPEPILIVPNTAPKSSVAEEVTEAIPKLSPEISHDPALSGSGTVDEVMVVQVLEFPCESVACMSFPCMTFPLTLRRVTSNDPEFEPSVPLATLTWPPTTETEIVAGVKPGRDA